MKFPRSDKNLCLAAEGDVGWAKCPRSGRLLCPGSYRSGNRSGRRSTEMAHPKLDSDCQVGTWKVPAGRPESD